MPVTLYACAVYACAVCERQYVTYAEAETCETQPITLIKGLLRDSGGNYCLALHEIARPSCWTGNETTVVASDIPIGATIWRLSRYDGWQAVIATRLIQLRHHEALMHENDFVTVCKDGGYEDGINGNYFD